MCIPITFIVIHCTCTGSYDYFMQKEIFEQPESIMNTMRGRVKFGDYSGEFLVHGVQHVSSRYTCSIINPFIKIPLNQDVV